MSTQSEFSLIDSYFTGTTSERDDVILGIGDDCALLQCPADHVVAVSIDTLVSGVHFFADVDAETLGHKSLAVGLSDLAAMGAKPAWFTLAITLPDSNEAWLQGFSQGLSKLANRHNIQLVGGDTTKGPLTISIQVHGFVKAEQALCRNQAQAGDLIYVSGSLGDAGAALQLKLDQWHDEQLTEQDLQYLIQRLEKPTPRNGLGIKLRDYATSAIDISDGLSSDLGHILNKSGFGATINLAELPLSAALKKIPHETAAQFALNSGDDYELCFTIPAARQQEFESQFANECSLIGTIEAKHGLRIIQLDGQQQIMTGAGGYDHFSA